jgi:hypothetical protein
MKVREILEREGKAKRLLEIARLKQSKEPTSSIKFRMAGLEAVKYQEKYRNMAPIRTPGDRGLQSREVLRP